MFVCNKVDVTKAEQLTKAMTTTMTKMKKTTKIKLKGVVTAAKPATKKCLTNRRLFSIS